MAQHRPRQRAQGNTLARAGDRQAADVSARRPVDWAVEHARRRRTPSRAHEGRGGLARPVCLRSSTRCRPSSSAPWLRARLVGTVPEWTILSVKDCACEPMRRHGDHLLSRPFDAQETFARGTYRLVWTGALDQGLALDVEFGFGRVAPGPAPFKRPAHLQCDLRRGQRCRRLARVGHNSRGGGRAGALVVRLDGEKTWLH
jgi:hypothetical protein